MFKRAVANCYDCCSFDSNGASQLELPSEVHNLVVLRRKGGVIRATRASNTRGGGEGRVCHDLARAANEARYFIRKGRAQVLFENGKCVRFEQDLLNAAQFQLQQRCGICDLECVCGVADVGAHMFEGTG